MRIAVIRHGEPKFHPLPKIAPRDIKSWIEGYNNSEISFDGIPEHTLDVAWTSEILVASNLRRSVESANALASDCSLIVESLFREADLPFNDWRFPTLSSAVLVATYRIGWFLGYSPNAESLKRANTRAKLGAERLTALAKENRSVSLVGHGIINSLIAKHLVALGWFGPKRPAHGYWQANIYHLAV